MSILAHVLTRAAVPDTSDVHAVAEFGDALLASVSLPGTLADLPDIHEASLPELTALTAAAFRASHDAAPTLLAELTRRLASTIRSLIFLDAADVALASPHLLEQAGDALAEACWSRYATARAAGDGDGAYNALQTIARLALAGATNELRLRDALLRLSPGDPPALLERAPRLLGLAAEVWGETRCRNVLQSLLDVREAAVDATVELALAELRDALNATTLPEAVASFAAARDRFSTAEVAEEARDDAAAYRSAIEAVLSLGTANAAEQINRVSEELDAILARRRAWLTGTHAAQWLGPRAQAEAEWATLVATLRAAAPDLQRHSWLTPAVAMERVLAAYAASRSVTVVPAGTATGIAAIIEPTVEGAFIVREGLLQHMRDLIATEQYASSSEARRLAERVADRQASEAQLSSGGGEDWGKVLTAAPDVARVLSPDAASDLVELAVGRPDLVADVNAAVRDMNAARMRTGHPLVDDLLSQLLTQLDESGEFRGTVREEFTALLTHTLRFLVDRADVGRQSGGQRTAYLFPWPPGEQQWHERELQRDYREWLRDGPLMDAVRVEEIDVSSGRADVTVSLPTSRYTVEIKRELSDASKDNLVASYAGQSIAYTGTSAALGMLLVLDLTAHQTVVPSVRDSVWCEVVQTPDGAPRFLIVGIVRGNRTTPSQQTLAATA